MVDYLGGRRYSAILNPVRPWKCVSLVNPAISSTCRYHQAAFHGLRLLATVGLHGDETYCIDPERPKIFQLTGR